MNYYLIDMILIIHFICEIIFQTGWVAVDPESELEERAHVYREQTQNGGFYCSVTLTLVDIENNKNSFHRIQMLESNDSHNKKYVNHVEFKCKSISNFI